MYTSPTLTNANIKSIIINTLRKKCYWINRISFQKYVDHRFKSICYRICNIFIGSCSIFLWIQSIHAFDSIAFFSQCTIIKKEIFKKEILRYNFKETQNF